MTIDENNGDQQSSLENLDRAEVKFYSPGARSKELVDRAFFTLEKVQFSVEDQHFTVDLLTTEEFFPGKAEFRQAQPQNLPLITENRKANRWMLDQIDRLDRNDPQMIARLKELEDKAQKEGKRGKFVLAHGDPMQPEPDEEELWLKENPWGMRISKHAVNAEGSYIFSDIQRVNPKGAPMVPAEEVIAHLQGQEDTGYIVIFSCNEKEHLIDPKSLKVPVIYYTSINANTGEDSNPRILYPSK